MDIDPKIFSKAKYSVVNLKKVTVLNRYPELKKYPEFNIEYGLHSDVMLNTDIVIRYCLIFYQKNDLHDIEASFMKRKTIAAELAGFERDVKTGRFNTRVEDILLGKNKTVNRLIARVKQLSDDLLFQEAVTYETVRYRHMLLLENGDEKTSKTSLDIIERTSVVLRDILEQMLRDDYNTQIREELYHAVVVASMPTPEAIARAKKDGNLEDLLDKPYEIEHPTLKMGKIRKL